MRGLGRADISECRVWGDGYSECGVRERAEHSECGVRGRADIVNAGIRGERRYSECRGRSGGRADIVNEGFRGERI
ncbi:unnamed protein product [Staurois parvus]|uniref:Uncharacterized protein n=1 Tax=Staurois parvus TaxID=386267 RepID=A0ABN9BDL8_9NEOB|nr:unnamed protein product [Staurois parvus]